MIIDQTTNNSELVKAQLKQKSLLSPRKKKLTPKKSPVWLYPISLEKKYNRGIINIINRYINVTIKDIKPLLPIWNQENKQTIDHIDSPSDDLNEINKKFQELKNEMFGENGETLRTLLLAIAIQLSSFNEKEFQKMLKKQTNTELILSEPWLQEMINQWVVNNTNLITNMTNDYTKKINNAIIDAFQKNKSMSDLSKTLTNINKEFRSGKSTTIFQLKDGKRIVYKDEDIKKSKKIQEKIAKWKKEGKIELITKGKTQSRSDLIARDQLTKLNSQITKKRQTEAGVTLYRWHTAVDERVRGKPGGRYPNARPSHWAMENKICKWDDSTVYADTIEDALNGKWKSRGSISGVQLHPGQDIQCRCWSEAIWDNVINEVNKELVA